MITIKGFAKLCGCNTQTLRYYDRIGLLIPARVDQWTGYRYYEENQAMRFVKIKNLQQADFSIEEIRPLLEADDDQLMEAFQQKIQEQTQKLERIPKIQRSYLKEAMKTQKMVMEEVMDQLSHDSLGKEQNLILSVTGEGNETQEEIPADAEKVFERSGWAHVSDWIDEIPNLGDDRMSYFVFQVCDDSPVADPVFPVLTLAVMATRYNAMNGGMQCKIGKSDDGQNHFTLLCK